MKTTKILNNLEYQAAMLAMNKLDAYEIKATIQLLYDEGFYLDDFLDALDAGQHPRMAEVLPSLLAAFKYQEIAVPSKDAAVWQLIEHHLNGIVAGEADPSVNLSKLIADVYWDFDFQSITTKYLGDSHDIALLVGLYWAFDDLKGSLNEDPISISKINAQIRLESERWLANH